MDVQAQRRLPVSSKPPFTQNAHGTNHTHHVQSREYTGIQSYVLVTTLNYVNSLKQLPSKLQFRSYGLLAIRTIGCIVLQLDMDSSGCHVKLLHEGGTFSTGEFIMKRVGGQDRAT